MSRSFFFRILVVSACCLFSATVPKTAGAQKITINDILDAWKHRQERVRSCRFTWEAEMTYPKGSLLGKRDTSGQTNQILPKEDTTVKGKVTLTLDGNQMRYTRNGLQWLSDKERFVESSYISVFDGTHSKSFYGYPKDVQKLGFVNEQKRGNIDASNGENRPILLTYRAHDQIMGVPDIDRLSILSDKTIFQDRECLVLEAFMKGSSFKNTYWVDPSRDFSIVRHIFSKRTGVVVTQDSISYQFDAAFGWVPMTWEGAVLNARNSKVREHLVAHVSKYEINIPIDPQGFQFAFPSETAVLDHEEGKKLYIIEKDGEKRYIESLNESERKTRHFAWYIIWTTLALAIIYGCVRINRGYRRKKQIDLQNNNSVEG